MYKFVHEMLKLEITDKGKQYSEFVMYIKINKLFPNYHIEVKKIINEHCFNNCGYVMSLDNGEKVLQWINEYDEMEKVINKLVGG